MSKPPFDSLNLARNIGDSSEAVHENHARLARAVGYRLEHLYEVSQVHGDRVEIVQPDTTVEGLRTREADALVAGLTARAVGVRVADCVPILLADPERGAVAAVHAGWRGVVAGVVLSGVGALSAQSGTQPGRLFAAIGPHIGPDAFEVGDEVASQLRAAVPEDPHVISERKPRPHADLGRAVHRLLLRAGLLPENIERVPGCTFSEPARFHSFRRDGRASGRHLAVIVTRC